MIVLSLVVLAVAGVLLVVGILQGNTDAGTVFLVASIAATLGAAALLYLGVRPRPAARDVMERDPDELPVRAAGTEAPVTDRTQVLAALPVVPPAGQQRRAGPAADRSAEDDDPPDEPAVETASAGYLERIAGRTDEVVVVDGRPRYHLAGCAHLTGREFEGLPVSEAAELGFTPCARCAPVATLLGSHRR
jgi:hypothetical protein